MTDVGIFITHSYLEIPYGSVSGIAIVLETLEISVIHKLFDGELLMRFLFTILL